MGLFAFLFGSKYKKVISASDTILEGIKDCESEIQFLLNKNNLKVSHDCDTEDLQRKIDAISRVKRLIEWSVSSARINALEKLGKESEDSAIDVMSYLIDSLAVTYTLSCEETHRYAFEKEEYREKDIDIEFLISDMLYIACRANNIETPKFEEIDIQELNDSDEIYKGKFEAILGKLYNLCSLIRDAYKPLLSDLSDEKIKYDIIVSLIRQDALYYLVQCLIPTMKYSNINPIKFETTIFLRNLKLLKSQTSETVQIASLLRLCDNEQLNELYDKANELGDYMNYLDNKKYI